MKKYTITEKEWEAVLITIQNLEKEKERLNGFLEGALKTVNYTHSSKKLPYKDEKLIENMCLSYRHDYGLLDEQVQEQLRFECKDWLRAYSNNK